MPITNRVGDIMKQRGVSPYQLAEQAHIAPNTALNMMRGTTKRIDLDVLEAICQVLQVTPGDILVLAPVPENEQENEQTHLPASQQARQKRR